MRLCDMTVIYFHITVFIAARSVVAYIISLLPERGVSGLPKARLLLAVIYMQRNWFLQSDYLGTLV